MTSKHGDCTGASRMPILSASLVSRRLRVVFGAVLLLHAVPAVAQGSGPTFRATRADLAARATTLESIAANGDSSKLARARARRDAARLRERLREGDFQVGDRIILQVLNDAALSDTFSVAAGRVLPLTNLGMVPLTGVLRSELTAHLQRELGKYFKEPQVTATPLVRVGVLGAVARPGYYALSPDIVVTDAVMQAGGPSTNADFARSIVRRGAQELFTSADFRVIAREGHTLDDMNLLAGDEIVVGTRKQVSWMSVIQAATAVMTVVGLVVTLASN